MNEAQSDARKLVHILCTSLEHAFGDSLAHGAEKIYGQKAESTTGGGRVRLLAVLLASKSRPEQPLLDTIVPTAAKNPLVQWY